MRISIIVLVSVLIVSCSSNAPKKSYSSSNDALFWGSMKTGCNMKYPDSEEMCLCHANVLLEATPPEVRSRFAIDKSAKMQLISIMIKSSEKLKACGERPASSKEKKVPVPTKCYSGSEKPIYYVNNDEVNDLKLTAKQRDLVDSVGSKVTMEELVNNFYSNVTEEMDEYRKVLDENIKSTEVGKDSNIKKIFDNSSKKAIQCSDKSIRKFYTADEVEALYKLYYAGLPIEDAKDVIFERSMSRKNINGLTRLQQREELTKYLKCEVTICMSR